MKQNSSTKADSGLSSQNSSNTVVVGSAFRQTINFWEEL